MRGAAEGPLDVLGLGMLGAIRRAFRCSMNSGGSDRTAPAKSIWRRCRARVQGPLYEMICRADTVGVSNRTRAQMSMLPRLRPQNYYDLVIERGHRAPADQGEMVHP